MKKIVIGIPSYNEEDTIGYVVQQVDKGLKRFFPREECQIVHVDSDSTDDTKGAVMRTRTFFPKKYFNAGKKIRGKGKNLIELFTYCDTHNVDYVAVCDSDVQSIKPQWVFSLLHPLTTGEVDFTVPVYSRGCYDGNVTNNFAYPLTYALFGVDLQQPIGGEFGFTRRLYRYFLQQPMDETTLGFGIDIFMTYHALGGGFNIREVYLGKKKHKPGFPTLMNKFLQFCQSAVAVSRMYLNRLDVQRTIRRCRDAPISKTTKRPDRKLAEAQLHRFSQEFKRSIEKQCYLRKELREEICRAMENVRAPAVSMHVWVEALAGFLTFCYRKDFAIRSLPTLCRLIAPIFYWRAISFWGEIGDLSPANIDKKIRRQGIVLRKRLFEEGIVKI